ncbi:unnamed protein product, partial [Rotaria magnacalcarata]
MFKIAFLGSALTIMLLYVWSRRNSYVFMNVLGLFNVQASHLQWILYGFSVLFDDPITADLMGIIIGHIYYSLEAIFPHKRGGFKILKTPKFLHRLLNQTTHYHDDNDTRRHIENWTLLIVDVFFLGLIMTQILSSNYETVDDLSLALLSKSTYLEGTALIWFDPNIGSHEDTAKTKQQLCRIHDNVIFVTDLDRCVTLIQSNNAEKIFLILSGSKAGQILSQTSSCRQIDSIFIFCMKKHRYENLLNEYTKIIGIFSNLNDLCLSIKRQIDLNNKQTQTFSIYDQEEKSIKRLTKDSAAFISFQLFKNVISSLPRNEQSKKQMIQICKQYYRGNTKEMKLIEEFEKNYQSRDAIRWYSKQSFVYKLINKALRTEDTDLLYTFRFFINDLSENLKYEHEKILMSDEIFLNVYRGVKLDKKE